MVLEVTSSVQRSGSDVQLPREGGSAWCTSVPPRPGNFLFRHVNRPNFARGGVGGVKCRFLSCSNHTVDGQNPAPLGGHAETIVCW